MIIKVSYRIRIYGSIDGDISRNKSSNSSRKSKLEKSTGAGNLGDGSHSDQLVRLPHRFLNRGEIKRCLLFINAESWSPETALCLPWEDKIGEPCAMHVSSVHVRHASYHRHIAFLFPFQSICCPPVLPSFQKETEALRYSAFSPSHSRPAKRHKGCTKGACSLWRRANYHSLKPNSYYMLQLYIYIYIAVTISLLSYFIKTVQTLRWSINKPHPRSSYVGSGWARSIFN